MTRARKGIPASCRSLAWLRLSGGYDLRAADPHLYEAVSAEAAKPGAVPENLASTIERDLNRTFPAHVAFEGRQGV